MSLLDWGSRELSKGFPIGLRSGSLDPGGLLGRGGGGGGGGGIFSGGFGGILQKGIETALDIIPGLFGDDDDGGGRGRGLPPTPPIIPQFPGIPRTSIGAIGDIFDVGRTDTGGLQVTIGGGQVSEPAPPTLPAVPGENGVARRSMGLFKAASLRSRPARVVCIPDPVSGEPRFFGHLGRPLLFSRDLSAARKVQKLASRARRSGATPTESNAQR